MINRQRLAAVMVAGAALFLARAGEAKGWDKAYMGALPDSAFASVESGPKGEKVRHLPFRDSSGQVDVAHLRSSLRLWSHVKWQNPADAQPALGLLKNQESILCASGRMTCGAKPKKAKQAKLKKPRFKKTAAVKTAAPKVAAAPKAPKARKLKLAHKPAPKKSVKPQPQKA